MLAVEVIVYLNQYHTSYDGESSHHVEIRAIGLGYLTDNPERFIEKVVDVALLQYLSDMSIQRTWADNIIIKAVSDAMILSIQII